MTNPVKALLKALLRSFGYDVVPRHRHLPDLWSNEPAFEALYERIRDHTLVPPERCFALYQVARSLRAAPGDMAEVGVYKGGTARLLAETLGDKTLHLFDTFEGMPDVDPAIDRHHRGDFADTSLEAVEAFLAGHGRVRTHVGFFPETAGPVENERFCLVYVDVDIHRSVRDCLDFFYPRMVAGGAMVFDDYESDKCPGVRKAIDEFLADKPEHQIVTARYQCAIFKH